MGGDPSHSLKCLIDSPPGSPSMVGSNDCVTAELRFPKRYGTCLQEDFGMRRTYVIGITVLFVVLGLALTADAALLRAKTCAPDTCAPKTCAPATCAPKTCAPKTCAADTCGPKRCGLLHRARTCEPKTCAPKTCAPKTCAPKTCAPDTCAPKRCRLLSRAKTCCPSTCAPKTCAPATCAPTACGPTEAKDSKKAPKVEKKAGAAPTVKEAPAVKNA